MGTYLNGQLVIADDLLVTGDVKLLGGGAIKTAGGNDLMLLPDTGGITVVGDAGSTSRGLVTNNDLFIAGKLEVDGTLYCDDGVLCAQSVTISDNAGVQFGTSVDTRIQWSTAQTPHTLIAGLGASRSIIFCEKADISVDFGHAQQVNPTVFIHSADATDITQWLSYAHNQTDGVIGVGKGDLVIQTPAQKTLRLGTVVWDDLRVPLARGALGVGNPPTFAQFMDDGAGSVGVNAYSFAHQAVAGNEEQLFFEVQLPHDYKEGTDIKAHLHWSPAVGGAAGEFVKWGLEYTWINIDGTFATTTIATSDASSAATATTSGDGTLSADKHYTTEIGADITGTGKLISSMLVCRLFRNSSHADDDLIQAAFGIEFDFHYQVDTLGSRQELIK